MTRLLLVRHGATTATEGGRFGRDEPLTDAARVVAGGLAAHLPTGGTVLASPAQRCRETATAAGLDAALEPELAECRFGSWEGRTFAEISADEPTLADGWLRDPDAAPHGGESLSTFAARVGAWLTRTAVRRDAETVIAITHAGVIRAAVVAALEAPVEVFWHVAVAPLSVTELRGAAGNWALTRLNWTAAL